MGEDALRRRDAGAHQEGRPVDGVEAQDVLADHVQVGRPVLRVQSVALDRDSRPR